MYNILRIPQIRISKCYGKFRNYTQDEYTIYYIIDEAFYRAVCTLYIHKSTQKVQKININFIASMLYKNIRCIVGIQVYYMDI